MRGELKVFSGSSHPDLARAICEYNEIPLGNAEIIRFSNENIMVRLMENVRGADVFVVQTSCPPVNEGVMELMIMIDALRYASAERITAVIPYFPYVRSDKKDKPRISITARLIADLLQTAGADRVLTMDLHSPQIQGFFHMPIDQLIAAPLICDYFRGKDISNTVLVAGDVGESKSIGRYANRLNLPIAIIDKRRDDDDEKAKAVHLIGDVEGKDALIIDDEVASGGTLVEAIHFLKKHGVNNISAAAVHPVLSGHAIERLRQTELEELVVTDSIPLQAKRSQYDKFHVLSVAPLLGDAIMRIHNADSISKLFR
ncbi:ribose-phosphate pyrophosphokinase [candidate division KSB3 bacterium]|uniref:Ribose-phosphate pyrophosphokinase n=1 Tax=candidate division KSB3 bacterium TaxID=2044937 RepID=A0A2G6E1D6_9BACT|nr:MAG: ribose-phosphate pyrophosphokinase [candidate division KSB3 bacterium]PIE28508.1 MAG: ribose-phosphate pyrophosphokinase [candidate division KSB3 bacterium]